MSKKKNKQNYNPTDDERKGALDVFRYELSMFWHALDIHTNITGKYSAIQKTVHNETLESLLVHTRNLYDFFYGSATKEDDIRAFHFIEGGQQSWRPAIPEYLRTIQPRINKYLSHLTYSRISKRATWDWMRIATEINNTYEEFIEALPAAEVAQWKIHNLLR